MGMEVVGSHYPVGPVKAVIAKVAGFIQFAGSGLALFGDRILPALGISQMPPALANMQRNKLASCMMFWFIGGTVQQTLLKTGAFEVYFDGRLVYSKLSTGEMPSREYLLSRIDSIMEDEPPGQPDSIGHTTLR